MNEQEFQELYERTNKIKINEMKDTPIVTITRVVDDDTGIWANDEFEFGLHEEYRKNYQGDKEACKRLANELRNVADMIERQGTS